MPSARSWLNQQMVTLDGVLDQNRAYQIGMRRLMKYRLQRLVHKTTTEMDALCYNVGDRIVLTEDIPGSNTISCLIDAMTTVDGMTTFSVSEPLDWSFANPRVPQWRFSRLCWRSTVTFLQLRHAIDCWTGSMNTPADGTGLSTGCGIWNTRWFVRPLFQSSDSW